VSAADWAERRSKSARALKRLGKLPVSETGKGAAVPLPYADRANYKKDFTNKQINAAIRHARVETVPIAGLHAIQHSVKADRVAQYIRDPDLRPPGDLHPRAGTPVDHPVEIQYKGKRYLHDGHHRTTAAILEGKKRIQARVARLG
jgi:hypothetical protein